MEAIHSLDTARFTQVETALRGSSPPGGADGRCAPRSASRQSHFRSRRPK